MYTDTVIDHNLPFTYTAICTDGRVRLLVGEDYDTEYFKEDQSGTV